MRGVTRIGWLFVELQRSCLRGVTRMGVVEQGPPWVQLPSHVRACSTYSMKCSPPRNRVVACKLFLTQVGLAIHQKVLGGCDLLICGVGHNRAYSAYRQCLYVGLARTIYIQGMYDIFGREFTRYTVIYIYTILDNPIYVIFSGEITIHMLLMVTRGGGHTYRTGS